jgi:very-short-patch-repair endonuclease
LAGILRYRTDTKEKARQLRRNLTDSESILWSRVRGKQLLGVQFYRQKPIGNYIVDFFAPRAKLVIEVDGSQHRREDNLQRDEFRDAYLADLGLKVLRFNSSEVLKETDAVVEVIYRAIVERLDSEIPPDPPLQKGGT